MSRLNKVNKDHYTVAGRLTVDQIAPNASVKAVRRLTLAGPIVLS